MADNKSPYIASDPTSDDPQSQASSQGWGKVLDGSEQTGQNFEDPSHQELGLQQPAIDPIDLAGGAIGSKIGGALAKDAGSILGNEVGAIGDWKKAGYKFSHKVDDGFHEITANLKGKPVAEFQFAKDDADGKLFPLLSEVDKEHQHQGLASEAYRMAEEKSGQTLKPSPSQTKDARGLWSQPNRPFGQDNQAKSGKLSYADGGQVQAPDMAPSAMPQQIQPQPIPSPDQRTHVLDQDGEMWTLPNNAVPQALKEGYSMPAPEQVAAYEQDKQYGTAMQQAKALAEGVGQGMTGPIAPYLETKMGIKPEDIRARQEVNPVSHYGGELGGLLIPGGVLGKALGHSGALAANLIKGGIEGAEATTLAGKIGTGAAKAAVENMMLAGSDEASKMILKDPSQSAQTALVDVGLSGLLGGALGGTMSAVAPLWKASVGNKLGQTIEDFKGRIQEHINNPNPVASTTDELGTFYKNMTDITDPVYGSSGLKSQDIAKALPIKITPAIDAQGEDIFNGLRGAIDDMKGKENRYPPRLVSKLEDDLQVFDKARTSQDVTERFNATNDLKQKVASYAKYDKFVKPVDEAYDFVNKAKELALDYRQKLEDSSAWGKAADRQKAINKGFQQYLPALKDFEKRFTTEVAGERQVDPGKINTYINQIGKPNAEIKQEMLKNFLDASQKYQKVIADTHNNLGMESPIVNSPLTSTTATLGKKTTGAKLADMFIEKGLTDAGGKSMGAAVGGGLGHALGGHEAIGALLGAHTLGPFFSSVLPAIVKPLIEMVGSSNGLKAATDYAVSVAKGESLAQRAVKNVFNVGSEVVAQNRMPDERSRNKLDKILKGLQQDPSPLYSQDSHIGHYLPDHSTAVSSTTANAVQYLNSLRPSTTKQSPLDSKPITSKAAQAKYDNALNIAQQPLLILHKIQQGQLNSEDLKTLSTIYPSLYDGLRSKMMEQVANAEHRGRTIPYKTRTSLSLFMGQPLDSTMKPMSIMSMQAVQSGKQGQQQAPQSPPGGGKGAPRSTASLSKLPGMYSTPAQTAAGRRQRAD